MNDFSTNLTFKTFEDGTNMQKELCKIKREKGYVTYKDFLNVKNPTTKYPEMYDNYGWINLIGMSVELNYDTMDYELKMPQIINLEFNIIK